MDTKYDNIIFSYLFFVLIQLYLCVLSSSHVYLDSCKKSRWFYISSLIICLLFDQTPYLLSL